MRSLQLVVEPYASDQLTQVVRDGLAFYNVAVTGLEDYHPLAIFLKDAHGEIWGGVLGHLWGQWLHITILWLAEPVRGQGYGRQLLEAAETYARERGCHHVKLETFSFQARPFYEQLGYEIFATLEDCPVGHREYFLRKSLEEAPESSGGRGSARPSRSESDTR
jgi:GNAT superfamily N-acetyltransferase